MTDTPIRWTQFTKRTNDPKLAYLERRLDALGIPHQRNGFSHHAPILEVPEDQLDAAWAILNEQVDMTSDGEPATMRLDDIPDNDLLFYEV